MKDGRMHNRALHHVVLEAFYGQRPDCLIGCHNDDDPLNNRADNLRWGTHADNAYDAIVNNRSGKHRTEEEIVHIRTLAACGVGNTQIARQMGCSNQRISDIVTGKTYANVGGPIRTESVKGRRTDLTWHPTPDGPHEIQTAGGGE